MRKLVLIALGLLCLGAKAQAQTCTGLPAAFPYAHESITVSSTAKAFTAATYNDGIHVPIMAIVTTETDQIRFWPDGGVPTASVGQLVNAGSVLLVCGQKAIQAFLGIRVTNDATLQVVYYSGQ